MRSSVAALRALHEGDSIAALRDAVGARVAALGVRHWVYAVDLPLAGEGARSFILGGYRQPWVERYLEQDYLRIDPLIAHCRAHGTPVSWQCVRDAVRVGERDSRTQRARRMFGEAGEFGLDDGLSVPLHGPGLRWGVMSFTAGRGDGVCFDELAPEVHLLAHHLHEIARRFQPSPQRDAPVQLTERERECLRWAAIGKTSWEIGRLLAVSERTVVFHLQNASRKLGVCNRQAAVARALALGLVDPC